MPRVYMKSEYEILRAHSFIHDLKDWDVYVKSNTELSYGTPQLDLFEDLRSKDTSRNQKGITGTLFCTECR